MVADFIKDFSDKVEEVNLYFNFIWILENTSKLQPNKFGIEKVKIYKQGRSIPAYTLTTLLDNKNEFVIQSEINKILKGNCYLVLYNLVEGSIAAGIKALFSAVNSKKYPLKNFKKEIFHVWLKYRYNSFLDVQRLSSIANKNLVLYLTDVFNNIFEDIFSIEDKNIKGGILKDYEAYISVAGSDFSGNLDTRKIKDIVGLYGISINDNIKCNSLFEVKNKRNALAHGNEIFSNAGKIPIEDLIRIKDEIIYFLDIVLKKIDSHIQNEHFVNKRKKIK